jgi:hypothetical protein
MQDYLLDPVTGDLMVVDGDLVIGDATLQNQKLLLFATPGSYKQYPIVGVDLMGFLKDEDQGDMMRAIRQQFTQDGMTVESLAYVNGQFYITAPYGN